MSWCACARLPRLVADQAAPLRVPARLRHRHDHHADPGPLQPKPRPGPDVSLAGARAVLARFAEVPKAQAARPPELSLGGPGHARGLCCATNERSRRRDASRTRAAACGSGRASQLYRRGGRRREHGDRLRAHRIRASGRAVFRRRGRRTRRGDQHRRIHVTRSGSLRQGHERELWPAVVDTTPDARCHVKVELPPGGTVLAADFLTDHRAHARGQATWSYPTPVAGADASQDFSVP